MSRWVWIWHIVTRRLWFRAAAFSMGAIVLALVAAVVAPFIPYDWSGKVGSDAVDNILQIIASSMLAVTTFSLTAMVSSYVAATNNVTPRAVKLLLEDSTAQNALSTFLGGFLFAIVGIIALSTEMYGDQGRVILFAGTIVVILIIVVTLLRWIEHIARFGRVADTIARVERAAIASVQTLSHAPRIAALAEPPVPANARAVTGDRIGYVTHVDLVEIERCALECDGAVHLAVLPGAFVDPARTLAWVTGGEDSLCHRIANAITIARDRSYENDPRFGLIVLAEIASRALSPAVNDPGTALAVLGSQLRVLRRLVAGPSNPCLHDRVILPAIALEDLVTDAFRPIARDGAAMVEVAIRLQKTLSAFASLCPDLEPAIRAAAAEYRARANDALASEADRTALARACQAIADR
ncbi:DUF2254 domain-containing protein [Sphingomonas sp.]